MNLSFLLSTQSTLLSLLARRDFSAISFRISGQFSLDELQNLNEARAIEIEIIMTLEPSSKKLTASTFPHHQDRDFPLHQFDFGHVLFARHGRFDAALDVE